MKRVSALLVLAFFFIAALALPLIASAQYRPPPPPPPPPPPSGGYWKYGPNPSWNPNWNRWPNPNRGACFYTTAPYRGNKFCVRAGDKLPRLPSNIGGNISSIQVFGRATVKIFNDRNFSNGSAEVRQNIPDLRQLPFRGGRNTWNNRISSLMVY